MIAFVFPGHGSQSIGMGRALADTHAEARDTFAAADAAFDAAAAAAGGRTLSSIIFDGPKEQLTLTEITQPAILTVSIAAYRVLAANGLRPAFVAGHSLGEYSANVAAGTMSFEDAVRIVQRRGRYMQEAVPAGQGAMAAILGLDAATVQRACDEAANGDVVSPANINGAGQIVISGSAAAVARAGERAKALGARRVIALDVSAPFHSALMRPAEARLEPELRDLAAHEPAMPIVANVDAKPKAQAWSAIDALVQQVSAPVRWEEVVQRLASDGVRTYVEVGPGTVLSGLIRKIHKDAHVVSFSSPDDLAAVTSACSISTEK